MVCFPTIITNPVVDRLVNKHPAWSLSQNTRMTLFSLWASNILITRGFPIKYLPSLLRSLKSASVGLFIFLVSDFTDSAMSALSWPKNCALMTNDLNSVLSGFIGGNPLVATTSLNFFFFSDGVEIPLEPSSPNCLIIISASLGSASKLTEPSLWYVTILFNNVMCWLSSGPMQPSHLNSYLSDSVSFKYFCPSSSPRTRKSSPCTNSITSLSGCRNTDVQACPWTKPLSRSFFV